MSKYSVLWLWQKVNGNKAFYSIDLYGGEFAQPIEKFKSIYSGAKKRGDE